MSNALKGPPQSPFLLFVTPPGSKRKQVSSAAEIGQSVAGSTNKRARRDTNQSPSPCSSLSPEAFDHEDTGKEVEAVTAERQPEDAEAELSASIYASSSMNLKKLKTSIRTAPKGLDCAYLRVFQAYTYDWMRWWSACACFWVYRWNVQSER